MPEKDTRYFDTRPPLPKDVDIRPSSNPRDEFESLKSMFEDRQRYPRFHPDRVMGILKAYWLRSLIDPSFSKGKAIGKADKYLRRLERIGPEVYEWATKPNSQHKNQSISARIRESYYPSTKTNR